MSLLNQLFKWFSYLFVLGVLGILGAYQWITIVTYSHAFEEVEEVPEHDIALILGTSRKLANGNPNPYFDYRIQAAVELYNAGKVKHFLVSGDNRERYYNEPKEMTEALITQGVPAEMITQDYAGLRTLDSVIRAKEIFGVDAMTIISQPFHVERALYIAHHHEIDASAYHAKNVSREYYVRYIREHGARLQMLADLYLLDREPRHLGDKEYIRISP